MKRNLIQLLVLSCILMYSCSKDKGINTDTSELKSASTAAVIHENVLVLDNSNSEDIRFDASSGELTFTFQDSTIEENNVLVVDLDTTGFIRKVTSVTNSSGFYTCQTEQATFEDVFNDTDFKLSTEIMNPSRALTRTMSNEEISEELTDGNHFIHPASVIYRTSDGIVQRDAVSGEFGEDMYTYIDFSGLEFYENSYVDLYISEGYAEFAPLFKFEFDFDGGIKKFKFWCDSTEFDFKTLLALDVAGSYSLDVDEELISDVIDISFKFMAGPIPIYIDFDCDIFGGYEMDASAELSATAGFQATRFVTFGVDYEDGSWSSFSSYEKEDTFYPVDIDSDASLSQRMELYPHFTVELFEIVGGTADIIPFIFNENNVNLVTTAWDSKIDLGMDARMSAYVEILGFTLFSYESDDWNLFTYNLWNSPDTVTLVSGNNQNGIVNQQLDTPVVLKVTDNFGNAIPLVRVDLEIVSGNGSFENTSLWTDENGLASIDWVLGSQKGEQEAKAIITMADGTDISGSPLYFTANTED